MKVCFIQPVNETLVKTSSGDGDLEKVHRHLERNSASWNILLSLRHNIQPAAAECRDPLASAWIAELQ